MKVVVANIANLVEVWLLKDFGLLTRLDHLVNQGEQRCIPLALLALGHSVSRRGVTVLKDIIIQLLERKNSTIVVSLTSWNLLHDSVLIKWIELVVVLLVRLVVEDRPSLTMGLEGLRFDHGLVGKLCLAFRCLVLGEIDTEAKDVLVQGCFDVFY